MTTYSIKAPNGKTYRIDGPAGADDAAVRSQVLKQYPDAATLPARTAAPQPAGGLYQGLPQDKALAIYRKAQSAITKNLSPDRQAAALEQFNADPRMTVIRKIAGLAPVTTRKQQVQEAARRTIAEARSAPSSIPASVRDMGASLIGSANDALFGLPARAAAAITGTPNDLMQEFARQEGQRAPITNLVGTLGASIATGAGLAKGAEVLGARALASGAPLAQKAGNVLQRLTMLKKGQTADNASRIALAGAAGGAADALGKGEDVSRGATYGAGGASVLHGGGKAIGFIGRPVADFLGLSSAKSILRRYTNTTAEEMAQKASDWRARTGEEPTVAELLPQGDREALKKAISLMPAKSREKLSGLLQERGANIGPEMAAQTGRIIAPAQSRRTARIANDLARAREQGVPAAAPTPEEAALAARASRSPVDLEQVRADEARSIMAPHDNTVVAGEFSDLIPQLHGQSADPEVASVLRSVAGVRRLGENITVRDVTDMISDLRDDVTRGGAEGRIAQRAIDHLQDQLPTEARAAAEQMTTAFAGRSRMMEGMAEGGRTRLREDVPVGDRAAARGVRQTYDTPEGSTGRALGQAARLERDVMQSPGTSLRAVDEIAANPTKQAAISANLGADEGARIADAALAQRESARNLAGLTKDVPVNSEAELGLSDIARSLISISPSALPSTRLWSVSRLGHLMMGLPEKKTLEIVDGLFSQNPGEIAKAMKFLHNAGDSGQQALRELGVALQAGRMAGQAGQSAGDPTNSTDALAPEDMPGGLTIPEAAPGQNQPADSGSDSPYAADLQHIYDNEDPELLNLVERVQGQESGGDQSAVSSAGAVGVMQVMPDTAPEAAQLAGLPWDEEAYHSDPAYNKLLGIAYLSHLLEKYDGNVEHALAAYNAGQGRVDDALSQGGDWLNNLPAETQDYVAKLG